MQPVTNGNYDSVAAFIDAVNGPCRSNNNAERDGFLNDNRGDWYGAECATGKDVIGKLEHGWNKGREKVSKLLDGFDTSNLIPRDMRRRTKRVDMGDHLDISAVYAGRLATAWTVARRQSSIAPQPINVVCNMICSAGENSDVLFWRGAAAIALCDKMEAAGYMVRLVVAFAGRTMTDEMASCRVEVKRHDMPLDIATASAVLMPGFFRALGHAWVAAHMARPGSASMPANQCGEIEPGEFLISHEVRSESTATTKLTKIMAEIAARYSDAA